MLSKSLLWSRGTHRKELHLLAASSAAGLSRRLHWRRQGFSRALSSPPKLLLHPHSWKVLLALTGCPSLPKETGTLRSRNNPDPF